MSAPGRLSLSTWACALAALALTVWLGRFLPDVAAGVIHAAAWEWSPGLGAALAFRIDGLGLLFALIVAGVGTLIFLYAGAYLRGHPHLDRLQGLLALFMISMLGVVLADDLLLLFVFWELTTVASYLLIGFDHERQEARQAAGRALLVTGAGGLCLLAGLLLLADAAGTTRLGELAPLGDSLRGHPRYPAILTLVLLGALTKSAQFPFHFWLPGAMAAPTPISAYLHSATMVKAGIYLLARLHPALGGTPAWMLALQAAGLITALWGSLMALRQTDLKLMLANTTLMALGTLTMLLGAESPPAIAAAVTFLLVHSLYKSALFLVVGNLDHACGTRELSRLGGLAPAMRLTALAAAGAAFSMAGFPPFLGFIGKELKYEGALALVNAPRLIAGAALAANAMMTAAALTIAWRPFAGRRLATPRAPHEAPLAMWLGPVLLALLGLGFGIDPDPVARCLVRPALASFFGEAPPVKLALYHGITAPLLLSFATLAAGWGLFRILPRAREILTTAAGRLPLRAEAVHDAVWDGLLRLAARLTRLLQDRPLRDHLAVLFAVAALLCGWALARGASLSPGPLPPPSARHWGPPLLIAAATLLVIATRSRLAAICALGVVGAGAALIFLTQGAPDLALTQLLVETLTVVIVALVLLRLPAPTVSGHRRSRAGRARDLMVALAAGADAACLLLAVLRHPYDPALGAYFAAQSVPAAHGRNIVNVILVDFRALDTLGEITVVVTAALAAYALLAPRSSGEGGRRQDGRGQRR